MTERVTQQYLLVYLCLVFLWNLVTKYIEYHQT